MVPSHAATGYGYIKAGARLHPSSPNALVERFVEKPDAARAAEFLAEGDHYWNAGIFVWRAYSFRQAVDRFQPVLGDAMDRIAAVHRTPGWMSQVRDILEPLPAITIDVGIAEPAAAEGRLAVVPLRAGWSDIGSWSALLEALSTARGKDLVASGRHLDRGSHGCSSTPAIGSSSRFASRIIIATRALSSSPPRPGRDESSRARRDRRTGGAYL